MDSTNLLIGVCMLVVVITFSIACQRKEGMGIESPYINPQQVYSAVRSESTTNLPNDAPGDWSVKTTSLHQLTTTEITAARSSANPGLHLQCTALCKNRSKGGDSEFMQVCTDTCIQERWTVDNAPLKRFKP